MIVFTPRYAELATTTNFSFLRGASHPEEMAPARWRSAIAGSASPTAIRLRASCARFPFCARMGKTPATSISPSARVSSSATERPDLLCYPQDRAAYGRLCRLLTRGNMRAAKGRLHALSFEDLLDFGEGQHLIVMENGAPPSALLDALKGRVWLAATALYGPRPRARLARTHRSSPNSSRLPLVAINDAHMHVPERRPLADVDRPAFARGRR